MAKHGKNYTSAAEKVEQRTYPLSEAVALAKENAWAKFDETIELAFLLGVDPRHADQMVRGVVALPSGTGKDITACQDNRDGLFLDRCRRGVAVIGDGTQNLFTQAKIRKIHTVRIRPAVWGGRPAPNFSRAGSAILGSSYGKSMMATAKPWPFPPVSLVSCS